MKITRYSLPLYAFATLSLSAQAEPTPRVSGSLTMELNDRVTNTDPGSRNDLYGLLEANVWLHLSEHIALQAVATMEPLADPEPLRDRAFEREDVRWKDVFVQYDNGSLGLRAGRLTANFGTAWWAAPGLDARALAEDYVVWDRMGASAWVRFKPAGVGNFTLGTSWFATDTSKLSESWRNTWHRRMPKQGGVSNTGKPESWTLSLEGSDHPALPGLSWHLAVLRQQVETRNNGLGVQTTNVADEKGSVAGVQKVFALTEKLRFTALGEAARLANRGGVPDAVARYVTLGGTLDYGPWSLQLASTERWRRGNTVREDDNLVAVTLGYQFTERLLVDAGWRQLRIASANEDNVRVRLKYVLPF